MQGYNCIMVYNVNKDCLLFCKRLKDPYKGLYNLGNCETSSQS